jgi:hypothetical protein
LYGQTRKGDKQEREFRVLNVRLNPDHHQTIHQLAVANGESIASTIRTLLRSGIEQRSAQVSR